MKWIGRKVEGDRRVFYIVKLSTLSWMVGPPFKTFKGPAKEEERAERTVDTRGSGPETEKKLEIGLEST